MRNKKIIGMVVAGFILALAAGLALGVGLTRVSMTRAGAETTSDPNAHARHGHLADELGLSSRQQEQMNDIWSKVRQGAGPDYGDKRRAFQKERDDAIANLIPANRKQDYDQILSDYKTRLDGLNAEHAKLYAQALEQTRQVLDPTQFQKFEEERRKHWDEHGHGPHPATQPTTGPQRRGPEQPVPSSPLSSQEQP
jgi:Spy/CpxP family protein refolding chaperone